MLLRDGERRKEFEREVLGGSRRKRVRGRRRRRREEIGGKSLMGRLEEVVETEK